MNIEELRRRYGDKAPISAFRILISRKRLVNAVRMGDADLVRDILFLGADANATDKRGNPMIVRAVRGIIVESSVVQALLDAGADPAAAGPDGLTALGHARRRLLKYEGKPRRPIRRSPSLTPHGDVKLIPEEHQFIEEMREEFPESADEFEEMYLEERRKAAERVYDTRGNLERIVELLEGLSPAT